MIVVLTLCHGQFVKLSTNRSAYIYLLFFEDQVGSRRRMLDIVFESEYFQHLFVKEAGADKWSLNLFLNPPPGWAKVKDNPKYTRDILAKNLHLIGVLSDEAKRYPTDSSLRWRDIDPLWFRPSGMYSHVEIRKAYLKLVFDTMLEEGVQYAEPRKFLGGGRLYVLDPDPKYKATWGQKIVDEEQGGYELRETIKFIEQYKQENKGLIGMKYIITTSRAFSKQLISTHLDRAVNFHKTFPQLVKGFDMCAQEDVGNSLLFHMENFLKIYNNISNENQIPLILHTAETIMPGDLLTSPNNLDPLPALSNAFDAILLDAKRVGHGIGYIKHPHLLNILRDKGIAVEICPVSNQILGFFTDARVHPAVNYIRSGVPVVLGSDDPGTFGYNSFTVDWYYAFLSWGLDLADLKLLARNSLQYSSMTPNEVRYAISEKWHPLWERYMREMKEEACQAKVSATPVFSKIFPLAGSLQGKTKVSIYGRNFEIGICKKMKCKFGEHITEALYVSNQLITCVSHDRGLNRVAMSVSLSVSFDNGLTFTKTGAEFTYKYKRYALPSDTSGAMLHFSHFVQISISMGLVFLTILKG